MEMSRIRGLLVLTLVVVLAQPVAAGWFDYEQEQYQATNQKYFGKPEATFEDFMGLDLSIIENADEDKMLYRQLKKLIEPREPALKELADKLTLLKPKVTRYFDALYAKEVHDEVWEQTRPIKQAAYKKALGEYIETYKEYRAEDTTYQHAVYIADSLKRIGKQFKEIEP